MNLKYMITSAIVRRVVYIAIAALCVYAGIGKAHAALLTKPSREAAYTAAQAELPQILPACKTVGGPNTTTQAERVAENAVPSYFATGECYLNGNRLATKNGQNAYTWNVAAQCPPGTTWNDSTKTCFDPSSCLAKNSEPGFAGVGVVTKPFSESCKGGCQYKVVAGTGGGCITVGGVGGGLKVCTGEYEFTGNACGLPPTPAPPDPLPDKPQECIPVAGQTVCLKANGDTCYSGAIGTTTQFCWKPGQTGEQSQGDQQQQRDAGPEAQPPRQLPTPPETLGNPTPPITTTTTTSSGGTITTTTITRTTGNGTTPPGTPANPGGDPGEGEEGDENGSTGGGDCLAPPINSGDALLSQIATQAWKIRCANDANNDGQPDWTDVTGEPHDGTGEDAEAGDIFAEGTEGGTGNTSDGFDMSGFGYARACPQIPTISVMGANIDLNTAALCNWLMVGGWFVLLLTGWRCVRIVGEA